MSDLEKREQETGNPSVQSDSNALDSEMITLTDEELEYIREMEQEEEEILSGKRTVKGLDSSEKENVSKSASAARTDRTDGARRTQGAGEDRGREAERESSNRGASNRGTSGRESSNRESSNRGASANERNPERGDARSGAGLQLPKGAQRDAREYPDRGASERRPADRRSSDRRPADDRYPDRRPSDRRPVDDRYSDRRPSDRGAYRNEGRGEERSMGSRNASGRPQGNGGSGNRDSGRPAGKITMEDRVDNFFRNHKQLFFFISRALIPVIYFYYEAIFNLTTVRNFWGMQTFYILLFSVFFGLIGSLLSSISKNRTVNMWLKAFFIFLPVIPFLIEYFVYLQFKVFYDLNTVLGGAADAAGGFQADIIRLITSPQGILHLVLYFLPTVLFLVFELAWDKKHLLSMKTGSKRKFKLAITMVAAYVVALIMIACVKKYRLVYDSEYYFESAVTDFGLMTGIRKEVWRKMTGANKQTNFDIGDADDSHVAEGDTTDSTKSTTPATSSSTGSEPGTEQVTTEQEKVYSANRYPISFSDLAKQDSGTYADLDKYVASLNATMQNEYTGLFEGKNLIFISAEAFSGDIISEKLTPTLYRMATKGINFTDYYQPASAGTTGGEYSNLIGMLPTMGGQSMKQLATYNNYFTMGSQLDRLGYYGKMYHNNDYTYYSRNLTHVNLGYCDGFEGYGNGAEAYISGGWPESDLEMVKGTFPQYINKQPFNIYYMSVSGHSAYSVASNAQTRKHWDEVQDLPYSDEVKSYIAANLEFEASLDWLVKNLDAAGILDDTVIVISADHFPYGLDNDAALGQMPYLSELYGYNVVNYLQRDHNRLIIWSGCLEKMDPIVVDTPVCSIDILPTLSNLFGTYWDSRLLPGRDVFSNAEPIMFNLFRNWKTDKGTYVDGEFVKNNASEKLGEDYEDRIQKIVNNKINYMYGVLETDYFGHLYNLGVFPTIEKKYDYTKAPTIWTEDVTEKRNGSGTSSGGTGNGGTDNGGAGEGGGADNSQGGVDENAGGEGVVINPN